MRLFISAGEPSGDIHGANLVEQLRRRRDDLDIVGFGGDHLEAAGSKLLYPLTKLAVMWFARVLANAGTFLSLVSRADRYFRHQRPDAVVLIDFPGMHWWLARRAKFHGIPVFYFVPPQLWAWAGWRVEKMRRFVDHVLCTLPFEPTWYQERGVHALYVGHPFFDEVRGQRLDADFLARERARPGTIVGILPGSRTQEIEHNLSSQMRAALHIHRSRPDVRFLVACYRPAHRRMVEDYLKRHPELPVDLHVGRTPEIIELATACLAVSGSVSLELLYRTTPTAIVYRISPLALRVAAVMKKSKYITLVNLLADRELFPEYLTDRNAGPDLAEQVLGWLNDPAALACRRQELADLRDRVGQPGACSHAADYILDTLAAGKGRRVA